MSVYLQPARHLILGLFVYLIAIGPATHAQAPAKGEKQQPREAATTEPADPAADLEARERRSMERFLALLEKNPRRGTPLDRVYGYHVERGTLDAYIKTLHDRLDKTPRDGTAWLILGLLEFQRGQDAAAVTALKNAETHRPADPLPSFYLGQALVLIGQPENAAEAFERALSRKPARTDLLDIFQALGRVYQRTQKNDQALQVWNRLEALFPGDTRVQEQIAQTLADENQPAAALPRFEALAKRATDPFRQVQLAIQAADLKVRLGRSQDALHDFEVMLSKLRPDSWLHREVRRKIEDVFLRNDDQAGLVAYYEQWSKKEPDDVEALVRLGRTLASMGRAAEAHVWFDKAVKLAPSRRDLRLALISQLVQDQKFAEAAKEYQALDQAEPNNPDTLRDWGALVLRDTTKPQPERKAAAAAIWRKMLDAKPNDPVTSAQVADLLRQAELTEPALALYRKAAALAPTNPQYYEYIGEYLHNLKRPEEARAAWAKIADGPNRSARTVARLSEVLSGFGYLKEALPQLKEAVGLEPDSFDLRLKLAALNHRLEKYDDAETQLAAAAKLAEKDEEKDAVLDARVKNDQAANRLAQRIETLRKELDGDAKSTASAWSVLARYLEADAKLAEAVHAADKAVEIDPRSIPAWTLAARVRESAGSLGDAAAALRRLAEIDRRNRIEHLTGVARLEARLGRVEEALKAGRDLLAAAPGNPDSYEFFAQLCFGLGRPEEGLDALRRAVRLDPNDTKITLTLAGTLAEQYRTDEAIEMYWRAFDKSEDLDARIGTVSRLAELYLQRNQLDRLFTRLQHQERDAAPGAAQAKGRDVAICMAQAYASSGDLGSARTELERLLATDTRDTRLLQQLSKLAEEEGDLETAARYQKQQNDVAPSDDGASRLAQLYARSGELEEAEAEWSRMAAGKSDRHRIFGAIDSLLAQKKPGPVTEITDALVRKDPHDWESIYRLGLSLVDQGKHDLAAERFRALLELPNSDDELSALSRSRSRDPKLNAASATPSALRQTTGQPVEQRLAQVALIRRAATIDNRLVITSRVLPTVWAPGDFGQARMASLAWLVTIAEKKSKAQGEALIAQIRKAGEKSPPQPRALWDWFYLGLVRYDNAGALAAGKLLSQGAPNDPLALWAYLYSLGGRERASGQRMIVGLNRGPQAKDTTPPLPAAELDHVMACYRSLRARRPELAESQILQIVFSELKRAKRTEDEEKLYRESIESATQIGQLAGVFGLAADKGDVESLLTLCDRYERLQSGRGQQFYYVGSFYFQGPTAAIEQCMTRRADSKAHDDILKIVDHQLAATRRRQERQSPGASRARSTGRVGSTYIRTSASGLMRQVQFSFPSPNEYLDESAIQVLRTAFDLYKRDDLLSDLVSHFRRLTAAASTPTDQNYPRLALASILWWNEDKEDAITEITIVAETSKPESDLRLDLAELLEQQGDRALALATTESVQPLDNTRMKRREELALRLSVSNGDLERARQAAERLFGLRLDTDTQVRLAGQMHQLGLHELAEAVLGRARRRAGNQASALTGMMVQYQRQGQLDVAVQVAMQILRSTNAIRPTTSINVRATGGTDANRTAAINVLARSGRLPQLIERATEQLKKTPNSIQLHQTLADYYQASGQREKATAELARVIALRPDDTTLRLQVALKLVQENQTAAAIEHYKVLLQKEPAVLSRYFYQVQQAFQQAGKTEELMTLLDQMDFKQFGQPAYLYNMISNMSNEKAFKARAASFIKKAWDAFPDDRTQLLQRMPRMDLWEMPEMEAYLREAIIPNPVTFQPLNQWYTSFQILSYGGNGRTTSGTSMILDSAARHGQLEQLRGQIETARKTMPEWTAGEVLGALLDCRLGRFDQARRGLLPLFDKKLDSNMSSNVYMIVGDELENHSATRDLAYKLYEAALNGPDDDPYSRLQFNGYGPLQRLLNLYERDHRVEDMRRLMVSFAKAEISTDAAISYPVDYLKQLKIQGLGTAADKLLELGFAADAVFLYNQAIGLTAELAPDSTRYFVSGNGSAGYFNEGLTRALQAVAPAELAAGLSRLIQSEDNPSASHGQTGNSKPLAGSAGTLVKPKKDEPFLDMMMLTHPRELDKARVRSLFAEAVTAAPAKRATGAEAGDDQLSTALEAARKKHPDDLGLAICEALRAISSNDPVRKGPVVSRLVQLVEKTPLETLEAGERANARQRAVAARQIPLWLVARACGNQNGDKQSSDLADKLAARALEAARRQTDNTFYLAMIREQGERALQRGDRAGAMAAWGRMLDVVVSPPQTKIKNTGKTPPGRPATSPAPPKAAKPAAPRTGMMLPARRRSLVRLVSHQNAGAAPEQTKQQQDANAPAAKRPGRPTEAGAAETPQAGGPSSKTARQGTNAAAGQSGPARKAAAARGAAAGAARSNLPILTLERFEQAMQIARLAAEHELPDLSLKAVHDALRAGPPVVPANNPNTRTVRMVRAGMEEDTSDPASPRVVANLMQLDPIWQKHKFPPARVYEALRDVVMPPARPTELFLYATPLESNALRNPLSVGKLLATWAVRSGKAGELRQAIAARQGHVMAQFPSLILNAQLALAAEEPVAALEALRAIAARMKNDTSRTTSELACHAAIPALEHRGPELAKVAIEVLDASSKGLETGGQPEPAGSLLLILARRGFQLGDPAGARKNLEAYLESADKSGIRYGGDYMLYIRKQHLENVAGEFARAGLSSDALAALGRFLDAPAYSGGDPPVVDSTLVGALSRIESSPPKEQYQTLHAWTMPEKDRRAVRMLTSAGGHQRAPAAFRRSASSPPGQTEAGAKPGASGPTSANDNRGGLSTARTLIEAARRAGTLDQLAEEARAAALLKTDKKIENAQVLHLLVELARGQGTKVVPEIESRTAELTRENQAHTGENAAQNRNVMRRAGAEPFIFSENDLQLARAALTDSSAAVIDSGRRLSEALAERARKAGSRPGLARIRAELAEVVARKEGAPAVLENANLAWWHPANAGFGYQAAGGWSPNYWTAQDGLVAHLAGSDVDLLLFDYPLAGTYEFSVDAYDGPWAESALSHNALVLEPSSLQGNALVSQIGELQPLVLPWGLSRRDGYNTITVKVSPQKVRYLVNGHLYFEDNDPGATSPWLGLFTHRDRHSVWRRFTLTGEPTIPREVKLCEGNRLDGWITAFYNETQPQRLIPGVFDPYGNRAIRNRANRSAAPGVQLNRRSPASQKPGEPVDPNMFDWTAADGVIHGRRVFSGSQPQRGVPMGGDGPSEADQSRLFYFRPLADGDALSYEFLFEPGQVMIHPALDRVVFLCEPGGVKLHWMTEGSADLSALAADNAIDEPENRRGPKELPLKPGQWNAMKLSMKAGKATLEMNGQTIYERPLEPGLSRQFSFFHFKDQTAAQARNVVLRGHWPEGLTAHQKANLTSSESASGSVAERRARRAFIDESIYALEAGGLVEETRRLAPKDRFERLAGWVLAAPDRPVWRLAGELSPSFPAPALAKEAGTTNAGGGSGSALPAGANRLETGGTITAPALELVAAAQAAGKLDELADKVQSASAEGGPESPEFERGRLALAGLIQIARGDDPAALKTIAAIQTPLKKLDPDDAPVYSRWPELLLTSRAIERPALVIQAAALMDIMLEQTRTRRHANGPYESLTLIWDQVLSHERARAHLLALADKDKTEGQPSRGIDAAFPGWARVTHNRAETRGHGIPMAQWDTHDGELKHYPGHDVDMVYLNVPLRGDFQLDCELSSTVGRKIRVMYGGVGVAPSNDLKSVERFQLGRSSPDLVLNPPLAKLGDWYPFRLVVKGGRVTALVSGRSVYDLAIPADADPWLALLCQGSETGAARGIKITGNPHIPRKLKLSGLPDLTGWLANEYGDVNSDDLEWDQRGEELSGTLHENVVGIKQESVLRYHRPMLEDGRIDYEFYFDPGKVMVHPTMDRLTFLIEPEGVKIHRLTDGAYERSGLSPENVSDEPENRRGNGPLPLKAQAWNHLALQLQGDKVTIELNGQAIYERRLEPENQRTFGLFHYADQTQVRVRNVSYQGNWPKALPESASPAGK